VAATQLTYVIVQNGDTLDSIAARYKTMPATVARLNRLERGAVLTAGLLLQVPKPPPEPAPKGKLPPRTRKPRYAFAVFTGQEGIYPGSEKTLAREGQEGLTGIFPLWFQVSPAEPWRLQSFATEDEMRAVVQTARERDVCVFATLTASYYKEGQGGRAVIRQAMMEFRETFADKLIRTYRYLGLDGILIDWVDVEPQDRGTFVEWLEYLGRSCKQAGLKLAVNVPVLPDVAGTPLIHLPRLDRIGASVDLVCLLVNTEHRMYTMPGPISSYRWAEAGVRHAIESGLTPAKILLGVAGYAYDWKQSSQIPDYLSFDGAMNRARQYRVHVQLDPRSQTPTYQYQEHSGTDHQVWFENTSSLSQKISLANRQELAGICLWRLGVEDPGLWPLLRARWGQVRKWGNGLRNIFYDK
jgi:spore germination protein